MVKKFIKFIEKSPYKDRFLKVIEDIYTNNLSQYDVKPLMGKPWLFRLRIWTVRFIFEKTDHWNIIKEVNNRWDIY